MKVGDLVRYKRGIFNEHVDKAIRERLGIITRLSKYRYDRYSFVLWFHQQRASPEYEKHLEVVEDNKIKRRTQ